MLTGTRLAGLLLFTTALTSPALALAQDPAAAPDTGAEGSPLGEQAQTPDNTQPGPETPAAEEPQVDEADVSIPGGQIVVTGQRRRDIQRASTQVVNVLSAEAIARTGEGDIAGALSRVTGLSTVGNGLVYVRGLGDRYSLALLNGLPLPSPEPLSRVVPLDLFPTDVIASSLVQKTYSANYPGEFGGGVINLTTRAVPRESFLTLGAGISGDTETTGHLGYTYYGAETDDFGFGNGQRNKPPLLRAFIASGARISDGTVDTTAIAAQLVSARTGLVQRWGHVAPNDSFNLTGGTSIDAGAGTLGV